MQKAALYGIIAAIVVAGTIGIAFATMSMNGDTSEPSIASQQQSSDVKVIAHAMGETEITGTPERVVVVDGELAENMLTLGVKPVGASLWKIFGTTFEEEMQRVGLQVPEGIRNVGDYWAPNLEAIAELEPDLIVTSESWNREIYDELGAIAPTLMFRTYPSQNGSTANIDDMEEDFVALADVLGKRQEAIATLDRLDSKIADAAAKIEQAGLKGHKFLVAEVWMSDGRPEMYLYTKNSVASQTLEKIGLQNALTTDQDANWGVITVGIEGLASLDNPDLHFFFGYYDTIDEANYYDTFDIVKNHQVMQTLEFVQKDQVYTLGPEFKPRPTPRHMEVIIDKVLDSLLDGNDTRVITHALGETEITGTPTRVIALEWIYAEDLLALGVQPVGVADIEDFNRWVNMKGLALDQSVVEVGHRWEPNLETMAQLEPDLIIGHVSNNAAIYDQLSEIAPTLIFNPDTSQSDIGQLEEMRQTFMTIADVVGRHDRGVEVLERMDRTIADAAQQISQSGKLEDRFVLALAFTWEDTTYIRIYANNALAVEVMEQMGMENAWDVDRAFWGYTDATLEDLATVEDADFFYIAQDDDNVFETTYKDNPVWKNLQFVKEGRVYHLEGVVTPTGGPITAEVLAEQVAAAITGKQ